MQDLNNKKQQNFQESLVNAFRYVSFEELT